jgi:hypothetical protein
MASALFLEVCMVYGVIKSVFCTLSLYDWRTVGLILKYFILYLFSLIHIKCPIHSQLNGVILLRDVIPDRKTE